MSGSHTAWLIPTTWSRGPTRKMVWLETVVGSIGPENGIVMRGWMLKPSSVFSTASSAQSDGRAVQDGNGRFTRRPVNCEWSRTVSRLVGNGCSPDVPANAAAGNASTIATTAIARRKTGIARTPFVPPGEID